jgi:hypothetical protein
VAVDMTDIFISYASPDRSKVEKLSAFLESKGYALIRIGARCFCPTLALAAATSTPPVFS